MKKSAIVIIFNSTRDSVVLVKRRDVPVWVLPGGGIDEGETPEIAAAREALEETGLIVRVKRAVAEYSPINRLASETFTYECQAVAGKLTTGDESREVDFFPLDKLPLTLFFIHQQWLEDALKASDTIIRKPLDQITYLGLLCYFCRHPIHVLRMLLSRFGFPINT